MKKRSVGHYWIKSRITEDPKKWEVGFLDKAGNWWIFGISGWFPEAELLEVGPEITPPEPMRSAAP